ncbi:MAG: hypothetical protein ACLFTK_03640 [Anaerolineales bacterium]
MTHSENTTPVDVKPRPARDVGVQIPLWLALVAMLVAIIIAALIALQLFGPLVSLVLPITAEVPVPPGSTEREYIDTSRTSDGEWLYGSDLDACQVARFYIDETDSTCNFTPYACITNDAGEFVESNPANTGTVAICRGQEEGIVDSFAWEVYISSRGGEYETLFRAYLYSER